MLIKFILKQEISLKKIFLILISPILLFIFEVNNSFSYIRFFESILPTFYIFILFSSLINSKEIGIDDLEKSTPYSNYKIYLYKTFIIFILFILNIIYNYFILRIAFNYKFDIGQIFIGENNYSEINTFYIFISGIISFIFYSSIMSFLQALFKEKWISIILTFIFSLMNLVNINLININSIYYYGNKWIYLKFIYVLLIIILQFIIMKLIDN